MQICHGKVPRARQLAGAGVERSRAARARLQWMDFYRTHGQNAALTCRRFGLSRQTFYRWQRRYHPEDLTPLEDRSHRPHRRRQPTWSPQLAEQVLRLRRQYPRWGKDKLVVLLHREGCQVSTSMVGRILTRLKQRGRLREPPRLRGAPRRPPRRRPYAVRKPRDWRVEQPGDLIQVDTLELRLLPGVVFKQFTARDVVSRWDVLEAHRRATAPAAARFLDTLQQRLPFPARALQVDGGSEFAAEFEQACRDRGLRLFVLPPRSPKLNGAVERAQRTHTEEFYEVTACSLPLAQLNQDLRAWEQVYNTVRPHQALGYLTPQQFLRRWESQRKELECH
ncbi:integrase core domain-containing protein [Acidobacteriia bacterium AH_259_A11_L15]|nr:integrase core domain-containing protein [Acidobacteriia bacterium AH_259_A11_L15]